jgi:hypothetical protein
MIEKIGGEGNKNERIEKKSEQITSPESHQGKEIYYPRQVLDSLLSRRFTRRDLLKFAGLGVAGLLVLALMRWLRRLGISLPQETPTPSPTSISTPTETPTPPPTPTPTPPPTPTPTPPPTPTPEHLDLERKFFPVLEELRKIPGNENLKVDWEMKTPFSGRMWSPKGDPNRAIYISYRVTGLKVIPLELLISGSWTINPNSGGWGYFKPDGRVSFDCSPKEVEARGIFSSCRVEGDRIIVNRPDLGIQLTFVVHDRAFYNVPRWEGELPPHKKNEK